MKKAKRLCIGDTVALVNPAGMPPLRFRHFIPLMERYLNKEGFQVKKYLANDDADPKQLAELFTQAWLDPDIRAVFPVCGGTVIFEVLSYLKAEILKQRRIIFCGSSTLSALSVWLAQQVQLVTFFGPHLPFIHSYAPQRENEFSVQSFWSMMMWKKGKTKNISSVHERRHFFSVKSQSDEVARITNIYHRSDLIREEKRRDVTFFSSAQKIIKGNTLCITIDVLSKMKRMGLISEISGSVLFTESVDWNLDQVKNALVELSDSQFFKGVNSLFITALTERTDRLERNFPELRDTKKLEALCGFLSDTLQLPILYGFPLGHGSYKITLPQGIPCSIDPHDGNVYLEERPVARNDP